MNLPLCAFAVACENIRFSSPFVNGDVLHVPPRETSPAAKSEEKRMFSQATFATGHYSFHGSRNNIQLTRCTTTVKKNGTTKRESQNRHSFSQYIVQGLKKSPIWSSEKSIFSCRASNFSSSLA